MMHSYAEDNYKTWNMLFVENLRPRHSPSNSSMSILFNIAAHILSRFCQKVPFPSALGQLSEELDIPSVDLRQYILCSKLNTEPTVSPDARHLPRQRDLIASS